MMEKLGNLEISLNDYLSIFVVVEVGNIFWNVMDPVIIIVEDI